LGRPLITISCHDDLTAADLLGRYLLNGECTQWHDGPLTRAVREGAVFYLDEIVEARKDTTVVIHSLTDHRRELFIERLGERLKAPDEFILVVSYNPGYQNIMKDLKPSTRQRMVCIELGFPPPDIEKRIIVNESGIDAALADDLVRLGQAIRQLDVPGLPEVASTRCLVAAADLIQKGLDPKEAIRAAILAPLCDDAPTIRRLMNMADTYFAT
ncbi:MAG: CbbQ/NirQ/NorQ/GpvN family protein, partial [Desulfatitalea sp.]|nr:CbbQ/NirQ/NorQ/GpvN family protein [Desulfatitalea sp.]NNK01334.1 CbbQ/NirQ/NorQ/GpvN family protein [Desulfatitalea sp.]